jgi:diguanylate cyclase (GGDEF)-like protein
MKNLHPLYHHYLEVLDIAFQPIVDIHSGVTYGVEALLRGTDDLGYDSIHSFFDALYQDGVLYSFDLNLREKVVEKFCKIEGYESLKLFYNLDNRLLDMADFAKGNTKRILKKFGVDHKNVVFELSERNEIMNTPSFLQLMHHYEEEGFCIAIDDFGIGYSGYKMLYHCTPHILKIDRFFLHGIEKDSKKKLLVRHIIQLATLIGCRVIAEGVERKEEFLVCKDIGCHMVQGYFVQYPTCEVSEIGHKSSAIAENIFVDKRLKTDQSVIMKRLEMLKPIVIGDSMESLLDLLKQEKEMFLVPVVNEHNYPIGIVHEHRLKTVIYSQFGRALIQNRSSNLSLLETYIEPIPIVDVTMPLETIIEHFSFNENAPGVLVVESSRYIGYLSARVMIGVVHERNLIRARDENPLTRLPGNFMINEYIARTLEREKKAVMVYFDFDHFKPYNDYYGFRNGDRVILLFAELMHKSLSNDYFKGHIGGDDFFLGIELSDEKNFDEVRGEVEALIAKFREDVQNFYEAKDRERGCIVAEDREGNVKEFKLLGVSAVVIRVGEQSAPLSSEHLQRTFAMEKKTAKKALSHMAVVTL